MTSPLAQPGLIVRSTEPLNVETALELLVDAETTPAELFFVRNHGAVPHVDAAAYRLGVGGLVETPLTLSLDDLRALGETVSVPATLACAGNRRSELDAFRAIPGELPWGAGAVGHAVWTGVRLRDVLAAAGVGSVARHVAFAGLDEVDVDGARIEFGASIPLEKAFSPEVLLAWEMNGEELRTEHGYPLRVVVPGYIGARSVKWLARVAVQDRPSSNYFQARGYRLYAAERDGDARAAASVALGEFSLTSALCRVRKTARGTVVAEGYALAGGTRTVERVDVSLDGGATWALATLSGRRVAGSWRLWRAELDATGAERELVVRAWDSAANTQPEEVGTLWNPRGYMNNAWHRHRLADPEAASARAS